MHHDCIRDVDFAACPSCGDFTNGLIWQPLPAVKEPVEVVVIVDSSDDDTEEVEDPSPKKKVRRKEQSCVICLEAETSKKDPLLEALCCRQMGHVSCLRGFYEIPAECKTVRDRNSIALKLGVPKCFVCRLECSNGVVGLVEMMPTLLPKVTGRASAMTPLEANKMLNAWYAMFDKHIKAQTKHCMHYMRFNRGTGWASLRDGTIYENELECSDQGLKIGDFRKELMGSIKRMVRVWAGLPVGAKFTAKTLSQFCLDNIVEVALTLELGNTCTLRRRPQGPDVPPFHTESYFVRLSTWELNGHFFDFDNVTDTFNSKSVTWNNKRVR